MGSSQAYMSVRISVRPYVSLYLLSLCISCLSDSLILCPVVHIAFWQSLAQPVIVRSACGRRSLEEIP